MACPFFSFVFVFLYCLDPFQSFLAFRIYIFHIFHLFQPSPIHQIFDSSCLRCTSFNRPNLTNCSLVIWSSDAGVVWIICLKRVFPLLHVNLMNAVVPKEVACLSLLRFFCGSALTLSSFLIFFTFLVLMLVLEDVSYGSKIWVMEIFVGVMLFCSCTGLYWLIFEFSLADLVMVLGHVWVVMVVSASPYPLLLINLLLWIKVVDVMMLWVYESDFMSESRFLFLYFSFFEKKYYAFAKKKKHWGKTLI